MTKAFYKSKELWVIVIGILNVVLNVLGVPYTIEPTPEFYTAILGLVGAIRLFFTQTKLSIKEK